MTIQHIQALQSVANARAQGPSGRAASFSALTQRGQPLDALVTISGQSRGVRSFTVNLLNVDEDWLAYIRNNPEYLLGLHGQVILTGNRFTGTVRVTVGQKTNLGFATVSGELIGINEAISPSQPTSRPLQHVQSQAGSQGPSFRSPTIDQRAPLPPADVSNAPVAPDCPPGQTLWVRGTDELGRAFDNPAGSTMAVVLANNPHLRPSNFYCRSNIETISPGQYTASDTARRARMEQALPADQGGAPRREPSPPSYQWGTLSGFPNHLFRGFGPAITASAFTTAAAQALNDHLVTNGCAGCSDMTSPLRQLTFAFKAALLTDPATMNAVVLNMSSMLAMTAYGPGTDAALKMVLSGVSVYANGPCTDDLGNCLGNFTTPITPAAIQTIERQLANQIVTVMKQVPYIPQPELANGLIQGFAALINQFGFELAKLQQATPPVVVAPPALPVTKVSTTTTTTTTPTPPAAGWTTGEKVAAGVAVGAVVVGTGFLLYHAGKKG